MKTITGTLLDITSGTILHQTNCCGVCGGLARALNRAHSRAFTGYYCHCRARGKDALGDFILGEATPALSIGHVFGQMAPGPNTDMLAVRKSLTIGRMVVFGPVFAPYKMGCGLGGGNWDEYQAILTEFFPESLTIVRRQEDQ